MRNNLVYYSTILLVNAVIMALELVGPRIIAPFFGSSAIVWTCIISTILISLCVGYYLGAFVSQKTKNIHTAITYTLILGALFILFSRIMSERVMHFLLPNQNLSLVLKSFISSFVIFSLPTILLSMIPILISNVLFKEDSKNITQKISGIFALGTAGALVGIVVSTFVLIPYVGTGKIFYLLSSFVILNALLFGISFYKISFSLLIFIANIIFYSQSGYSNLLVEKDSLYSRIFIYETQHGENKEPIRVMQLNEDINAGIYVNNPDKILYEYNQKIFDILSRKDTLHNILFLGGAAFTLPRHCLTQFPNTEIHVVEIDPALEILAKEYFNLKNHPNLKIFNEDARTFLKRTNLTKYDAIVCDYFSSTTSIPDYLATLETTSELKNILEAHGVVIVNIIGSLGGEYSRFPKAEFNTFVTSFPFSRLTPVHSKTDTMRLQNLLIVASGQNIDNLLIDTNNAHYYNTNHLTQNFILTDDFSSFSYLNSIQ